MVEYLGVTESRSILALKCTVNGWF